MTAKPLSFAEIMKRKKPATATRDIALDPAVVDAYDLAKAARAEAQRVARDADDDTVGDARGRLVDADDALEIAEKALRQSVVTFTFRARGGTEYEALLAAHRPTPEQIAENKDKGLNAPQWNDKTFPQALVAASCVEPDLDEAQVAELWTSEKWNEAERLELFFGAYAANSAKPVPREVARKG